MLRVCVALLACTACTTDPASPGRVFDACESLIVTAEVASDAELADLDRGIAAWHVVGVMAPVRATTAPAVRVVFEPGALAYYGQYDGATATLYINARLAGDARAIVIAHELGHALGLAHVSTHDSVMNEGNLAIAPNLHDAGALESLWGACAVTQPP